MKYVKLYESFVSENEESLKKVLSSFNSDIKIASKDEHDIVSAYEEVIAAYKQQFPQFAKEIDAEFERGSKEEEKRINDLNK